MVEESDSDEAIVPSTVLDAARNKGRYTPIRQERKKTERPKKGSKTTGFTLDTPEGPLHKSLKGKHIDKEMAEGSSDKKDRKPTSVFVDDGVGDTGELMEGIEKRRKSTLKEFFPKAGHTVAIADPRKRQRTVSAVEKEEKEESDYEMEDAETYRHYGLEEEAEEQEEPPPAVLQEVNSQEPRTVFGTPRASNSLNSFYFRSPNSPRNAERRNTRAMTDRVNVEKLEAAWRKYEAKGEKMLIEAASKSHEHEYFPDLHRLKETDFCLVRVDSLVPDDTESMPIPRSVGLTEFNDRAQVSLPWDDDYVTRFGLNRKIIIKRELTAFVESEIECLLDVKRLFERLYSTNRIPLLEKYFRLLESPSNVRQHNFLELIRRIAELALRGPELFPGCIPVCDTNGITECSVTLSQEQCACLLANAFFGLFPVENRRNFNNFDLISIFRSTDRVSLEKLRFFINYFSEVLNKMPTGCVSFRRVAVKKDELNIAILDYVSLSEVGVQKVGIEECHHALQVDFANSYIGGGTLGHGAVQEEIRFLCSPEMMVSMLLCPKMRNNEAIFIVGARQYSDYTGYSDSLCFKKLESDVNQNWDKFRRIRCEVVAIDAVNFGTGYRYRQREQFYESEINREILKAYVGFSRKGISSDGALAPVATGNWGCGAFCGDHYLKSIIQLIAASAAHRDIVYCPFECKKIAVRFCQLKEKLAQKAFSVGELYATVLQYQRKEHFSLFDYLNLVCDRKNESDC